MTWSVMMWMIDQSENTFAIHLEVTDNTLQEMDEDTVKSFQNALLPRGVVGPKPPLGSVDRCLDPFWSAGLTLPWVVGCRTPLGSLLGG